MEGKNKRKLIRRRNPELYLKYFYNSDDILGNIVYKYDNNIEITEDDYDVAFNVPIQFKDKILELITYYPILLKKIKTINVEDINNIYEIYGETIEIMKTSDSKTNVRGKLRNSISVSIRNRKKDLSVDLTSEDILLKKTCPILGIPIIYGKSYTSGNSPSIDRIDNELNYTKDNIQLISLLANMMKSSANPEQLIKFSEYMIETYKK